MAVRETFHPVSKMAAIEVEHVAHLYWNRRRVEQMRERLLESVQAGDEQRMLEDFLAKSDVLRVAVPGACDPTGALNKRDFLWHCENLVLRRKRSAGTWRTREPKAAVRPGAARGRGALRDRDAPFLD
jgi:hypothetical protein